MDGWIDFSAKTEVYFFYVRKVAHSTKQSMLNVLNINCKCSLKFFLSQQVTNFLQLLEKSAKKCFSFGEKLETF